MGRGEGGGVLRRVVTRRPPAGAPMYGPCVERESTDTITPPLNLNARVVVPFANLMLCSPSRSPLYVSKCRDT